MKFAHDGGPGMSRALYSLPPSLASTVNWTSHFVYAFFHYSTSHFVVPLRNSLRSFCNRPLGRFWFELYPLDMDCILPMRTLHDFSAAAPNATAPSVKLILYFVLIVMLGNFEVSVAAAVAAVTEDLVQRGNFVWADDCWETLSTVAETIDLAIILDSFDYSNSTADTFAAREAPSRVTCPKPEAADVLSPLV